MTIGIASDTADAGGLLPYVFTKHPSLIGIGIGLYLAVLMILLVVLLM